MIYILDASFVGAQFIPDEINPHTTKLYDNIKINDIKYAPQLIWYEISNIFMNLIRRKRYNYDEVSDFFHFLPGMHIITDSESGIEYSKRILRLCNEYNLSSYDAAYLELAERKNAVLCTLDDDLRRSAKNFGVSVIK
ncbi:MAG: type II toxin-antitoxin system VapC family toxin [Treponema sp.]|nr:type II toxin-antitoxin system VapC family toxin [Treponema sp.]